MPRTRAPQSRSFALLKHDAPSVVVCRFHDATSARPSIYIEKTQLLGRGRLAATLPPLFDVDATIELWQTKQYTHTTPPGAVFDVPIVHDLLVYPVVFRVVCGPHSTSAPTVGRVRKLLCEHLMQQTALMMPNQEDDDEDEDLAGPDGDEEDDATESTDDESDVDSEASGSLYSDDDYDEQDSDVGSDEDEDLLYEDCQMEPAVTRRAAAAQRCHKKRRTTAKPNLT